MTCRVARLREHTGWRIEEDGRGPFPIADYWVIDDGDKYEEHEPGETAKAPVSLRKIALAGAAIQYYNIRILAKRIGHVMDMYSLSELIDAGLEPRDVNRSQRNTDLMMLCDKISEKYDLLGMTDMAKHYSTKARQYMERR